MYEITLVFFPTHPNSQPIFRGSPLGNPISIDDFNNRNQACDKYQTYFDKKLLINDPVFLYELKRLNSIGKEQGYLKLGCFCSNRRCHCETIKNFLINNEYLFEEHV